MKKILILLLLLLSAAGCTPGHYKQSAEENLYPLTYVTPPQITSYHNIDRRSLRNAIVKNLSYLEGLDKDTEFNYGGRIVRAGDVARSQRTFLQVIDNAVSEEMLEVLLDYMFEWYRASGVDGSGKVIFTGYYVPEVEGSLYPSEKYRYPLYRPPADLRKEVPYYTREEVDGEKALEGKGLEIVWLDDPVEAYFLHIQGSGMVRLPDGSLAGVHYAGNNGRPYVSIGKILIDEGVVKPHEGSLQRFKKYLWNNPDKATALLYKNPRYIFFDINSKPATGSIQVPLTPGHSIATDPAIFPRGGLSFIATTVPVVDPSGTVTCWKPLRRFVLNQDEGGAIKGPGRVDIFWGTGPEAGLTAGSMKEKGGLYFLLQK